LAGIYLHIPFCKQACHYCNFHFATSLRYKNELIAALVKEIELRKDYTGDELIETIYFGGGTPSLLSNDELTLLMQSIHNNFRLADQAEVTFEANPDDIDEQRLEEWKVAGINRLSIGVQSFFEDDLRWMNRAHNAVQALQRLELALKHFDNVTMDLIYGSPGLTNEKWKYNVEKAIALGVPHLSCYALTVEPSTPLDKMIRLQQSADVNPDRQSEQFLLLMDWLEAAGYEHYEISNYAKHGKRSRHNSSYWQGKRYLGLGPSAHSFSGSTRQWNVSNNNKYIESIEKGLIPFEKEELTETQQLNEYIMTSLRTAEGLNLSRVDTAAATVISTNGQRYVDRGMMTIKNGCLVLTKEGKLFADGIAADLFF
jgi:oxygen-independent coproporphyrinogen-3 oxidase